MSDDDPPCAQTGAADRYTAENDPNHEYICSYCGQTMAADMSTLMNGVSTDLRHAQFNYAGHHFYWRG